MSAKNFYDHIPVGVCILQYNARPPHIIYVNKSFLHIMGIEQQAQNCPGLELASLLPDQEMDALNQTLQNPHPPHNLTLSVSRNRTKDPRWAALHIEEGVFEGENVLILWATDISAHKKTEKELKQAARAADESAEMKSNFLATMSHEIRTPMQSVYGLLELIGEEKPPENIMAMVTTAKNSASGLLEILDDILDFAKMDADKMELDCFEVPVRTLVYGINEAMAVKVHGKNVELKDDIAKDVPFVVIGDPKRLRQIIMNLCGNALKFTAKGTVTIRVTTQIQNIMPPPKGIGLRFEIIDTGIGMTEEARNRLFQPFSQADNSTSRKYGGTGLGLSICKALVELMDGKIGVTSLVGKGSVFWFEIPTQEVGTEAMTANLPKLDGLTVLSVEDHPQGAKEIVRSLESMGAKIESCPTYKEGLELAKRRPFDVAIIDQGLPDGLGLDLIREIMEIRPFMGLIMYTVRDDMGLQHSLNALGVKYLTKPASRLGLGEAVKDAARQISQINTDGPTRLLIAEDTESVRDVLRRQLEKLGVEADFVENGTQALKALDTGKYGILFTDLHMPDIDGYEVVAALREKEQKDQHFPVIVLTADVQMAQRQTYLNHGFDECLLKPVSLGQFRRLLIRWGLLDDTEIPVETTPQEEEEEEEEEEKDNKQDDGLPPAIDQQAMKEQMGAVDAGTIEMLHMFVDMTQPLIERIQKAHENNDFHDLYEAAHSLKGGSRSACCNVLGEIASRLQDSSGIKKDNCGILVQQILAEFARVRLAVKELKPSP